ncbi:hypothetical protein ACH5RR_008047 [Cinchona calisaya]|uniref:BHLH domain-containing protein n=1 Tax=Cinchona calisaya TaxID=153742 RepID=A0ABD3AA93_9GENT
MMAGNPNWWGMSGSMHFPSSTPPPFHPSDQYNLYGESSTNLSSNSLADHHLPSNQDFPRSWSQRLLGGLANNNEQERFVVGSPPFQNNKKLENWEDQILNPSLIRAPVAHDDVKQEVDHDQSNTTTSLFYGGAGVDEKLIQDSSTSARPSWSQVVVPASSPTSCVTSLSSSLLNFSGSKANRKNQHPENSPECNSTSTGGVAKKPRIQHSSTQPALKVRKEKLGDRITTLHQLVSPFGKTDTASVLSEAIAYIRFLQAQTEALSSPYLGHEGHQQLSDVQDRPKDLKSRGLCLIPVSCTQHIGSENGADYWAPALGGEF